MRIAIIDLGTNSVRFDVHQFGPGKRVKVLHREKIMVRLGQGVFAGGRLDRAAITRTLHAFTRFKKLCDRLRVESVRAFATSALRDVAESDAHQFIEQVRARTGIEVRVISGSEEAKLISLGVLANESLGKGKAALVDIGGGSTEISIVRDGKVLHSMSFPLGTARLQQLFVSQTPPGPKAMSELRQYVRGTLATTLTSERWPRVDRVIGSSGTIRSLTRMVSGQEKGEFTRGDLSELVNEMEEMTTSELLGIPGIEAKRVDMIVAGAALFEECMKALRAKRARSTEFSLRDGILEEELLLYKQGGGSNLRIHLDTIAAKAAEFGLDLAYVRRSVGLCSEVFDRLKPVHKLSDHWRLYLKAAMMLRDVGEKVALQRHEEHSYYIVKHTDLPPMEEWELEMIARLVKHHEGDKATFKDFDLSPGKSSPALRRTRRQAYLRLLSLLRVADALDAGLDSRVKIRKVKLGRKQVEIFYGGTGLSGLESVNMEMNSTLFETTFGRELVARRLER